MARGTLFARASLSFVSDERHQVLTMQIKLPCFRDGAGTVIDVLGGVLWKSSETARPFHSADFFGMGEFRTLRRRRLTVLKRLCVVVGGGLGSFE
jgi:hypothetical protein